MPKYRQNHRVQRYMRSEPNCSKALKQITAVTKSPWYSKTNSAEKAKLIEFLTEIRRRNGCLEFRRLNEITMFISNMYKNYNR